MAKARKKRGEAKRRGKPHTCPAPPPTIEWAGDHIRLIDQRRLPGELVYLEIREIPELVEAIRTLAVRGAPALGVAAALGIALAAVRARATTAVTLARQINLAERAIRSSRPTAVNLFHGLDRMRAELTAALVSETGAEAVRRRLVTRACAILEEDRRLCRAIGEAGEPLFSDGDVVITHCNAGALATAGIGTALAPLFVAASRGKRLRVFADETRPLLQGARLTTWELMQAGLDVTLICDNMAAAAMREHKITVAITGADRIAANGDTANKIGTYGLALLAKAHGVPFYVAAPSTTFDLECPDGSRIPIEERSPEEVSAPAGRRVAPAEARVWNPAFDVTPARLVAAFITEQGVLRPPFGRSIRKAFGSMKRDAGESACTP